MVTLSRRNRYDFIVGSAAEVSLGIATYSSIQTAIDQASTGDRILVLNGNFTEDIVINKEVAIIGQGASTTITGTINLTIDAARCLIKWLRFTGDLTVDANSNWHFIRECWQANGSSITDNGTDNSILVIQE